jgi:hypothetical protein
LASGSTTTNAPIAMRLAPNATSTTTDTQSSLLPCGVDEGSGT